MKICLITAYDEVYTELAKLTINRNAAYALRWKWEYRIRRVFPERRAEWGKIKFLLDEIDNFDYLFWLDADAMIVKQNANLASIFTHELMICKDVNSYNAGVFGIKCGDYMKRFLREVWKQPDNRENEQGGMKNLIAQDWEGITGKIRHLNANLFNAYPGLNYRHGSSVIAHAPGCTMEEKIFRLSNLCQSLKPNQGDCGCGKPHGLLRQNRIKRSG